MYSSRYWLVYVQLCKVDYLSIFMSSSQTSLTFPTPEHALNTSQHTSTSRFSHLNTWTYTEHLPTHVYKQIQSFEHLNIHETPPNTRLQTDSVIWTPEHTRNTSQHTSTNRFSHLNTWTYTEHLPTHVYKQIQSFELPFCDICLWRINIQN